MSCTVVVGGQYGSEGKGKVVASLARSLSEPWVVRCGGPNSGHTVDVGGRDVIVRQVPGGVANTAATLLVAAGCAIDEELLLSEIAALGVEKRRIIVDPRAVLIEQEDRIAETEVVERIASTGTGTGAALRRRMSRQTSVRLAAHSEKLAERATIKKVAPLLHEVLDRDGDVVVEGTQGFGLSLYHGPQYPFVTARDTTASGFCSEVGIGPRDVARVVVVIRTFPIRVGGRSGPLPEEITWEDVALLGSAPSAFPEYTSVTKRLRRVARFDMRAVRDACAYNRATDLAIMGLDRLDYANTEAPAVEALTSSSVAFVRGVEDATRVKTRWLGTGFRTRHLIEI